MADVKATTKLLKTISFLSGLSNASYTMLARQTSERTFKAGKTIFREGSTGNSLYIVTQGEVDIVKGRGKNEVMLARRSAGEFFGEMSIIESTKRSATLRAHTNVTALEVPGDTMIRALLKSPKTLLETTRMLSERLRQTDTLIITGLKKKNNELRKAYKALQEAQEELIEKKRLEHEMELARELQASLLPHELTSIEDFHFAGETREADAVGGDFFDVISIGPRYFGVLIASVDSVGVNAAIYMALVRALTVAEGQRQYSPKIVVERVHDLLMKLSKPAMMVSMFYGVVDVRDHTMKYVIAGHDAPLIRHVDGRIESLPGEGTRLAASQNVTLEERIVSLRSGHTLLMYTSGLVSAENSASEVFGVDRLVKTLSEDFRSPRGLCNSVFTDLETHMGQVTQSDDQALLIISVIG